MAWAIDISTFIEGGEKVKKLLYISIIILAVILIRMTLNVLGLPNGEVILKNVLGEPSLINNTIVFTLLGLMIYIAYFKPSANKE